MESREPDTNYEAEVNDDINDNPSSHHNDDDDDRSQPLTGDGASTGKIFIGGLARETTSAQFVKHFGKYGEITDSVIMKDRRTGQPRGFGFITYADPAVVDAVIQNTHILNGKQVEIKRTIPKGAIGSKDFKTKKIFVGGIPTSVNEDEFSDFFSTFGVVKEHQIMRDHASNRSRGFGFVTFDTEEAVDELLSKGNRIEFAGTKVEIKKAEPKKPNAPPPFSKCYNDSRPSYGGGFGNDAYGGGYGGGGYGPASYRAGAAYGARAGGYGGYGGSEFGSYGGYCAGGMGAYRGDLSYGYSGRYGGGGYSRGYDMGGGGYGGTSEGYGAYGGAAAGSGYGGGYDSAMGGSYGGSSGGSLYGSGSSSRGGYSGAAANGRYHPYSR
ncbi:RNA-binding protein squid-like [Chenopodium quinoa]|uniref:RRM domain-containing protein n=1 Tax=Chenopodium quinoa TaxID=63459 RepID=A0A803N480_CHEQI|nr:RNA-binding protein squid-like [Chenopodium quinoa]